MAVLLGIAIPLLLIGLLVLAAVKEEKAVLASRSPLPGAADPLPGAADPLPGAADPLPGAADPLPGAADPRPVAEEPGSTEADAA